MTVQNDTTLTSPVQDDAAEAHGVTLTPAAVEMAKELRAREGRDDLRLRLAVAPGGCRGLSYELTFDDELLDGDHVRSFDGMELVVDDFSKDKLVGASIDYEDGLQGKGFKIDNPNVQPGNGCACGDSFC